MSAKDDARGVTSKRIRDAARGLTGKAARDDASGVTGKRARDEATGVAGKKARDAARGDTGRELVEAAGGVPITKRALVQRINRKLLKEKDEVLKASRGGKWHHAVGDYYIVDANEDVVVAHHQDLQELARELKVLKAYERLVED